METIWLLNTRVLFDHFLNLISFQPLATLLHDDKSKVLFKAVKTIGCAIT